MYHHEGGGEDNMHGHSDVDQEKWISCSGEEHIILLGPIYVKQRNYV